MGNRDSISSHASVSRRQREGGLFLSTRLGKPDRKSEQLRAEMHQLAADVKTGRQAVVPYYGRAYEPTNPGIYTNLNVRKL